MHHLLVHGRADRGGIAPVALERRHRAARANLALGTRIQIFGRHARRHRLAQLLEHVADELVHLAQPPKLRRRSADDHERFLGATATIWSIFVASSFAT